MVKLNFIPFRKLKLAVLRSSNIYYLIQRRRVSGCNSPTSTKPTNFRQNAPNFNFALHYPKIKIFSPRFCIS